MAASSDLLFQYPASKVGPKLRRRELRQFWADLAGKLGKGRAAVCWIADDAELRRLNRDFRKNDYATDVLSFPGAANGADLGEIAISCERAAAQAKDLGHSVDDEIRILMLHGLLHLMGLDHETDRGEMARAETRWRRRLGLPAGLIERTTS